MSAGRSRMIAGALGVVVVLAAGALAVGQAGEGAAPVEPAPATSSPAVAAASPGSAASPTAGPSARSGEFRSAISAVTAARLGSSHRAGCPVPVSDLRLVTVTHRSEDGRTAQGEIVVHADVAPAVVDIFRALYDAAFPLTRVATVEEFGGDDDRVMAANVTSGYNCRQKTGGSTFSAHAYGRAIDVNPIQNPYVRGDEVLPPAGRAFLDRSDVRPGMVLAGDAVVRAFSAAGWKWGGDFRSFRDYQHFSQTGD